MPLTRGSLTPASFVSDLGRAMVWLKFVAADGLSLPDAPETAGPEAGFVLF